MLKTYTQYKINNQTILEEHIDDNYEPTEEELHEYATYIGIDVEKVTANWKEFFLEISFARLGTGSSLVGERRSYETVTIRLESLSRREW